VKPEPLRILVLSGLGKDSGCMLRARYLTASLKNAGAEATLAPGIGTLPLFLDLTASALWNLRLLFSPCEVIIACKPLPSVTPLLMLKGMRGAVTVVDIDDLDYGYRTGLLSWITRRMQTPFPKRCNMVTYHNESLVRVIRDAFRVNPEHLFQLPQGVDLGVFQPRPQPAHRNGRGPGPVVVYPAHLNLASDLDAIFEVVRLAHHVLPSLRLMVIGGGPKERHFRRLAKAKNLDGYVEFTGYVQPERVPSYLAMGDAGIAYYKDIEVNYYRSSMKLREMLSTGLKVV
jgi:glycosyltransferase involved in cell wall biosynthesis